MTSQPGLKYEPPDAAAVRAKVFSEPLPFVQSFEGPEKVLEVWFKVKGEQAGKRESPVKQLIAEAKENGLPMAMLDALRPSVASASASACAESRIGSGSGSAHAEECKKACAKTSGKGASTSESEEAHDGSPEAFPGKPDGLPLPVAQVRPFKHGTNGVPHGTHGKPDGLGAQAATAATTTTATPTRATTPQPVEIGGNKLGLRGVAKETWVELLSLVRCTILSHTSNDFCDAFVLSESSLFVFPYRIILKTCGTTTLLACVTRLLEIARERGIEEVEDVFYCRKNFLYPDKQLFPHSSFADECKFLDQFFEGSGYVLGKTNTDHWYLYITDQSAEVESTPTEDQTLEVLMTELDPEAAQQFYKNSRFVDTRTVTKKSGIADLFPGALLDDFMFDPCGYSMNGLLNEVYFTIHVTPQPQCSYASFETNASYSDYTELITKVLRVFKPKNFFVTLFANIHHAPALHSTFPGEMEGCKKAAKILYEFENNYKLSFCHYLSPHSEKLTDKPKKLKRVGTNGRLTDFAALQTDHTEHSATTTSTSTSERATQTSPKQAALEAGTLSVGRESPLQLPALPAAPSLPLSAASSSVSVSVGHSSHLAHAHAPHLAVAAHHRDAFPVLIAAQ